MEVTCQYPYGCLCSLLCGAVEMDGGDTCEMVVRPFFTAGVFVCGNGSPFLCAVSPCIVLIIPQYIHSFCPALSILPMFLWQTVFPCTLHPYLHSFLMTLLVLILCVLHTWTTFDFVGCRSHSCGTVGELTYLGDRVTAGGGCEAAVTARTKIIIIMVIFKCYFFREHIALSIK